MGWFIQFPYISGGPAFFVFLLDFVVGCLSSFGCFFGLCGSSDFSLRTSSAQVFRGCLSSCSSRLSRLRGLCALGVLLVVFVGTRVCAGGVFFCAVGVAGGIISVPCHGAMCVVVCAVFEQAVT